MIRHFEIGMELPSLDFGPITRSMIAEFARQSGDHNPIHLDRNFAQSAGLEDVIVHGSLTLALITRLLTDIVGAERLERTNMRFLAITPVGAVVTVSGTVAEHFTEDGTDKLRIAMKAKTGDGIQTVAGIATAIKP